MDKNIVKGNWREIKGKLKQKWGKFSDDEILKMQGTYDELAGHLQKKYGYLKDQAEREIDSFLNENGWYDDQP